MNTDQSLLEFDGESLPPEGAKRLGERVRDRRNELGMSQEVLAERIGRIREAHGQRPAFTREAVSRIETGKTKRPDESTLIALERILGISRQEAYQLMGLPLPPSPESIMLQLYRLDQIQDEQERLRAIARLPIEVQHLLMRLTADLMRGAQQQLLESMRQANGPRRPTDQNHL